MQRKERSGSYVETQKLRGNIWYIVNRLYVTPKAASQWRELAPDLDIEESLKVVVEKGIRSFADGSPFLISEDVQGLRLVFCVSKGKLVESGEFTLVKVQIKYAK